jgi:hypothetical protein
LNYFSKSDASCPYKYASAIRFNTYPMQRNLFAFGSKPIVFASSTSIVLLFSALSSTK